MTLLTFFPKHKFVPCRSSRLGYKPSPEIIRKHVITEGIYEKNIAIKLVHIWRNCWNAQFTKLLNCNIILLQINVFLLLLLLLLLLSSFFCLFVFFTENEGRAISNNWKILLNLWESEMKYWLNSKIRKVWNLVPWGYIWIFTAVFHSKSITRFCKISSWNLSSNFIDHHSNRICFRQGIV